MVDFVADSFACMDESFPFLHIRCTGVGGHLSLQQSLSSRYGTRRAVDTPPKKPLRDFRLRKEFFSFNGSFNAFALIQLNAVITQSTYR